MSVTLQASQQTPQKAPGFSFSKVQTSFSEGIDGSNRLTGLAENFAAFRKNVPLKQSCGSLGNGLTTIDIFNSTYWWVNGTRKSWQHTAGTACSTIRQLIVGAQSFGMDLPSIAGNIGTVPVLSLVTHSFRVVGYSFSLWHHVNVISKSNTQMRVAELSRNYWKDLHDNVKFFTEHFDNCPQLDSYIENWKLSEQDKQDLSASEPIEPGKQHDRLKQLAGRVKHYSENYAKALCDKRKSQTAAIFAINHIALGLLTIVGLLYIPVLVGTVGTAYGLYMSVYGTGIFLYHQSLPKYT